jgi:hypothetical protein
LAEQAGTAAASLARDAAPVLIAATFAIGLAVDQHGGLAGQLAVAVAAWVMFFHVVRRAPPDWRLPLFLCLAWSTAGEIFLSLVWGLYTYRLENLPFFIPPGHVLLFYLGLVLAPRVPRQFVLLVPVCAAGYALHASTSGSDTLSIPLIALFILCWMHAPGRRLYSVMLVAALALELYGTWMGNWAWHAEVPYLGLYSGNPPLAAGAFYCALDVLVGMSARALRRLPGRRLVSPAPVRAPG